MSFVRFGTLRMKGTSRVGLIRAARAERRYPSKIASFVKPLPGKFSFRMKKPAYRNRLMTKSEVIEELTLHVVKKMVLLIANIALAIFTYKTIMLFSGRKDLKYNELFE